MSCRRHRARGCKRASAQTLPSFPVAAAPPEDAVHRRMGGLLRGSPEPGPAGGSSGSAGGRLALLWIVPLTLSGLLGVAWGASSLGAHHIHHFHGSSKHHSVPIAIYRSPASLRGGHGGFGCRSVFPARWAARRAPLAPHLHPPRRAQAKGCGGPGTPNLGRGRGEGGGS